MGRLSFLPPIHGQVPRDADKTFGFSTKQLDAETGMNYYGYRYYAADVGRWINRDSITYPVHAPYRRPSV